MMEFHDLSEIYAKGLKDIFYDDFKIDYENQCVVLDGETEEFFIALYGDDEVRLYWCNECFVFSKQRNLYTLSDTNGEIIYEGNIDINTLPDIVINLILNIKDCEYISKHEVEIGKTPSGYDSVKKYFIKAKSFENVKTAYKLENIEVEFLRDDAQS